MLVAELPDLHRVVVVGLGAILRLRGDIVKTVLAHLGCFMKQWIRIILMM